MKIGVISSYACVRAFNNYGALLQYYALQVYLRGRGHDVFWIRSILPQSSIHIFLRNLKNYRSLKLVYKFYKCHKSFIDFQKKFLKVSSREYKGNSDLMVNTPCADLYITGSDQVWGGMLKENYLCFVQDPLKKVAYAASFGRNHLDANQVNVVKPWIKKFKAISVREKSGVQLCESLFGVHAEHLLDPTLLIDASYYPTLNSHKVTNLLYCYFLNVKSDNEVRIEEIRDFARKLGLSLRIASCQYSEIFFKLQELDMPSPEQWLQNYRDAKYIVTNTFHGTVFSIVFRKQFVTILQSGKSSPQNDRLISLLSMLGLEDRIIMADQSFDITISKPIDWDRIEKILAHYREKTNIFFNAIGV